MSDNGLTQKSSTLPLSMPLQSRRPCVQNESRGLTYMSDNGLTQKVLRRHSRRPYKADTRVCRMKVEV